MAEPGYFYWPESGPYRYFHDFQEVLAFAYQAWGEGNHGSITGHYDREICIPSGLLDVIFSSCAYCWERDSGCQCRNDR